MIPTPLPRNVVYEIFVDRFAGLGGAALPPADATGQIWDRHAGGTLDGIAARLGHVHSLGADAIYLTPVFPAPSNHKYDATSYDEVDARFGGDTAFETLAARCRESETGLILDGVFNHVGRDHAWFRDAERDAGAATAKYFRWINHPAEYRCWRGRKGLPELDLDNPGLRSKLFGREDSVARQWLRRGATGWRLDCANDIGFGACADVVRATRAENAPDGVIGEVMGYAEEWTADGCLDGVMNYYFRETVLGLLRGEIPVAQVAYNFKRMANRYRYPALVRSWNVLSSHDTPRLANLVPDRNARKLAFTLAFMYPGIPMLYYGEETGMNGGCDPENRAPMVWDSALWDTGLSRHIRLLSDIRANSPALRIGGYVPMPQPGLPSLLAFARTGADPRETVLMLANASDKHLDARVFAPLSHLFDSLPMRDLLNPDRKTAVSSGTVRVSLTPWEATALVPDDSLTPEYSFFRTMPAS